MVKSKPIGDRFPWADSVCARAIANTDGLSGNAVDFIFQTADRLDRYGAGTMFSKAQLDWLEGIADKLEE